MNFGLCFATPHILGGVNKLIPKGNIPVQSEGVMKQLRWWDCTLAIFISDRASILRASPRTPGTLSGKAIEAWKALRDLCLQRVATFIKALKVCATGRLLWWAWTLISRHLFRAGQNFNKPRHFFSPVLRWVQMSVFHVTARRKHISEKPSHQHRTQHPGPQSMTRCRQCPDEGRSLRSSPCSNRRMAR